MRAFLVVGAVAQCVCGFSAGRVAPLRRDAAPRQIACAAKGGKGGAAAAALEALAALEQAAPQEEAPTVAEPSPFKKPQGGGKGGAAAAALAALEGLGFDDEEQKRPELEKSGWKKKDKSGKGGAAAAALAALEGLDLGDGETNQAVLDVVGKKKDKGGKGGASKAALAALEGFDFDEDEAKAVLDAVGGKEAKLDFAEEDWRKPEAVGDGRRAEPELKESRSKKMDLGEDDFDDDVGAKKSKKNKAQAEEEGVGGKKGKKNKKGKRNDVEAEAEVPSFTSGNANDADEDLTLEEKKKRERGNAKVRIIDRDSRAGVATMSLSKVSMIFRNTEVLKDASWRVTSGDRVGIVGANGGGKTTMLKIFSGELEPTSGEVITSSERLNVAYLRQEFSESLVLTRSLREELASVFTAEAAALERLRVVELAVEGGDSAVATLDEFAEAQDVVNKLGANTVEGKCEKVAIQMGFGDADLEAVVGSFSGGWKMRIGLAKVLLEQPDVLLLDEPTNHLDLDSVYWLEEFLRQQTIAIVTVSHDREFIDQVCTKIVDVEDGVTVSYDDCNYSQFLKRKEQRRQAWESAYKKQQSKINEDKEFINRFRAGARAAQAQSREKMLDKLIKSSDIVLKPPSQKRGLAFRFPEPPRCGVDVLSAKSVAHGYGDRELFRDVSFELRRGDRVAILGPNGAGKSTLLRLLAGIEAADEGGCEFGSANVAAAYFAQNQADAMDMSKTVLRTIEDASLSDGAERSYETLRALLGQFLFKGDDVQKHLSSLSGGEKARVALCRMMLEANNVLFLDEPTNHLDIPAKEMLEDALVHFDGTLVVVSHDRYFVSQVCNTIFNLENGSMERFDCDYASYLEAKSGLKGKVEGRYVAGVKKIEKAKVVDFDDMQKNEKRSFGGKAAGVSGRKDKGIKNAKRMA